MADIQEIIRRKAAQYGVDPALLLRTAEIESSYNPNAGKGKAYQGLFQFGTKEWKDWGRGDIFDPEANADAAARRFKNLVIPAIDQATGGKSDPYHYYMGWQQGVGGTPALIANPDQPAAETLAPFYGNGVPAQGLKGATAAIVGNGGGAGWSGRDFLEHWKNKYSGAPTMPATQVVGNGLLSNPAMTDDPNKDADLAGYNTTGVVQPYPTAPAKDPAPFDNVGLMGTGMKTMAAGSEQQPDWVQKAMSQQLAVHRPQMQSLLTDTQNMTPDFQGLLSDPRRRRGLLGI